MRGHLVCPIAGRGRCCCGDQLRALVIADDVVQVLDVKQGWRFQSGPLVDQSHQHGRFEAHGLECAEVFRSLLLSDLLRAQSTSSIR